MFLDNKKIGLFGGSFDPAHLGHVNFSFEAAKHFNLDQVIWLISPGNPLKPKAPEPIVSRVTGAKNIISSPKIIITVPVQVIASPIEVRVVTYIKIITI